MTSPSPTAFTRLKRVAAFVAIVWVLAASFVVFDLAALAGFDLALGTGAGRALGLSGDVRNSTACTVPAGAHPDPARVNGAAATAWVLGLMSGTHAFVSRWDDDGNGGGEPSTPQWRTIARERSAQAARNVEQLAAELQVTKPGPFEARNRVDANIAYVTAVEKNDNETARTIAAQVRRVDLSRVQARRLLGVRSGASRGPAGSAVGIRHRDRIPRAESRRARTSLDPRPRCDAVERHDRTAREGDGGARRRDHQLPGAHAVSEARGAGWPYRPPLTSMNPPVVNDASGDSSQIIACATSSTVPPRFIGTNALTRSTRFGSPPLACISV